MRIGIVAERLGSQVGGLETYERGLLQGLMSLNEDHEYQVFCSSRRGLEDLDGVDPRFTFTPVCEMSTWLRFLVGLPLKMRRAGLEVVHSCFVPPPFFPGRLVATLHDLAPFSHPEYLPLSINLRLRFHLSRAIKKSDKLIAVSQTTKNDIVAYFGTDPGKITVIPLGLEAHFRVMKKTADFQEVLRRHGIDGEYILYMGRVEPRKNLAGLFQAYKLLKKTRKIPHKLVIGGKIQDWGREEVARCEAMGISEDVTFPGYLPRTVLPYLYNGAAVFVFPSLFEGFGLPPLEAMACGTPVVASNIPALAEVLGEAAVLVDPQDVERLAQSIAELLHPGERRQQAIAQGLLQASRFTWEETARRTLAVYREMVEGGSTPGARG